MADELIQQTAPETTIQSTEQAAPEMDLAAHMAIALGNGIPPQAVPPESTVTTQEPPVVVEDRSAGDPFGLFKEKFGYETPDAAIKEIEELRAFRAQPRPEEFIVPDHESAAIMRAIKAGNRVEIHRILDQEIRIDNLLSADVTKENAADIVKMGMQLKYKDQNLTPDEINYKFNKQFSIPPKPTQAIDEDDADYQQRLSVWQEQANDKQMELMIEAKLAKPELQNAKGKLEIPDIETPVDEGYVQYQQMLETRTQQDQETKAAYQKLNPKAIETKLDFKDEPNKIAFQFQYEPDADGFKQAVEIASNMDLFWQTFSNPDGTPNREKFLKAIYFVNNEEKILLAALNQSKNATIKAQLPDNNQGGLVRQVPQSQEPNELEKQMRQALAGYGQYR